MSYLFDTDTLSNTMKKKPSEALVRRIVATATEEQFTTTITLGEMVYGAMRTTRSEEILRRLVDEIWPHFGIVAFDVAAAETYGRVRALLEKQGTPAAEADLRIAAIALSRDLTLVTGNLRHFQHIPGLVVENWL